MQKASNVITSKSMQKRELSRGKGLFRFYNVDARLWWLGNFYPRVPATIASHPYCLQINREKGQQIKRPVVDNSYKKNLKAKVSQNEKLQIYLESQKRENIC